MDSNDYKRMTSFCFFLNEMSPVVDFQIVGKEVERNGDDKYENVQKKEDSRSHVWSDDVPLHSVNVGQLAKETKPVVD